jgi:putative glutamine amidotransferase
MDSPHQPHRPRIGVCAALERARWAVWDMPATLVADNYLAAVREAGGVALLIPPDSAVADDPDVVLDVLDGLLLVGGPDVDPAAYGAVRHPETEPPVHVRDAVEIALVTRARERGIPTLGVCRGIQVMNVAAGGTLEQHLPERLGTEEHRRALGRFAGNEHAVELEAGSAAADACGEPVHTVASHHHQALDRLGRGLVVTGSSPGDGVPEAVEDPDAAYYLGVQWHPEADEGSPVIGSLVRAARRAMGAPGGTA